MKNNRSEDLDGAEYAVIPKIADLVGGGQVPPTANPIEWGLWPARFYFGHMGYWPHTHTR